MKNINFNLVQENESNVFANLVSASVAKTLESVTFIEKDAETTIAVKYDVETLPSFKELQNFGIEPFAYCSKVGSGKKTFILAKRNTDNLTVFADIETLRKSFGISYNIKINNVADLQKAANNFIIANGFSKVPQVGLKQCLISFWYKEEETKQKEESKLAKAKAEAEKAKAEAEAANAKNAALEAELLALKKQLGLI